jgi:hypothetical protein
MKATMCSPGRAAKTISVTLLSLMLFTAVSLQTQGQTYTTFYKASPELVKQLDSPLAHRVSFTKTIARAFPDAAWFVCIFRMMFTARVYC